MATILVLDDDRRFADSLKALLEGLGYAVMAAGSVAAAREACADQKPDLALVDLVLPGEEPDVLVGELRAAGGDLPVVLMSGFFQGGDAVERMQRLCGTDLFLAKPFDFDRLVALLRRQLGDPTALSEGAQEPELDEHGSLAKTSLATVLIRAANEVEPCIVDIVNQRGKHRLFFRDRRLRFWQSDQPGLNLPGLLGLRHSDIALAEALARHRNLSLMEALCAQQLCTEGQAIRAYTKGARTLLETGLLSSGRVMQRSCADFSEWLPDLNLELDGLVLRGIVQAHPKRVRHYLEPRSSGLLLPGVSWDRLAALHEQIFPGGVRAQIDASGTMTATILGRLWSDPRRRDRVFAELYALQVSEQVLVLISSEDAPGVESGLGVIQVDAEHYHDPLDGLDPETIATREQIRRLSAQQRDLNHYEVLGIEFGESATGVAEAFRNLFSEYHTDRFLATDLGSDLELLQRILARWGEARDLLTDETARVEYDLGLERRASGASADVDALLAADGVVRRAERALESGHFRQARGFVAELLALRPNAEQYQFFDAFAAAMTGETDAQGAYTTMSELASQVQVPRGERMLGQLALRLGDNAKAKRHFKAAVSAHGDDHVAKRELRRLGA